MKKSGILLATREEDTHKHLMCTQTKDDNLVAVHVPEEILLTEAMKGGLSSCDRKLELLLSFCL